MKTYLSLKVGRWAKSPDDDISDCRRVSPPESIDNPYGPSAGGALAAESLTFERPGAVEVVATAGIVDQPADGAVGRGDIKLHVAGKRGRETDLDRHAIYQVIERCVARKAETSRIAIRDDGRDVQHVHRVRKFITCRAPR